MGGKSCLLLRSDIQVRNEIFMSEEFTVINVRSLSSRTFTFMGMFDLDEDLIPLIQSSGGNAPF